MQVQDTVKRVIARKTPKATAYTVQLEKEGYVGVGFAAPPCTEGDTVSLQYELNDRGYKQMIKGSMQVLASGAAPAQPQAQAAPAGAGPGAGPSKQDYWGEKEKRDLQTQRAIQYQASRNAAIDVAKMALENDCLSLGAKKSDKLDILLGFIDEITDRFNQDVSDVVQDGKRSSKYDDNEQDNNAQEVGAFE